MYLTVVTFYMWAITIGQYSNNIACYSYQAVSYSPFIYIYTCFNVVYGSALIHHVYICMACSLSYANTYELSHEYVAMKLQLQYYCCIYDCNHYMVFIFTAPDCVLYTSTYCTQPFAFLFTMLWYFFLTAVVHSCLLQSNSYLWHLYLLHLYYIIAWFLLNSRG
jgi:hypothetical protein